MLSGGSGKCFVSALKDSLRANVNPASGGHLAVHHQSGAIQLVEIFPVAPVADEIRIGDEHARGVGVGAKNSHRLAGLNEQCFVVFERAERIDDGVVTIPVASSLAASAVDDQVFWLFGDFRVEVVHQHAESRFLLPAFAGNRGAARGALGLVAGGFFGGEFRHRNSSEAILSQTGFSNTFAKIEWDGMAWVAI